MKKNFKKGLLALLLAPTMLFAAACTRDISMSEYMEKMGNSAEKYYQTTTIDVNRTVEVKMNSESSYKQWVYWGEADESGSREDFTSTSIVTQKFEIGKNDLGHHLRVTETDKTTVNGFKEKEDETGYEPSTTVTETKTVTTYTVVLGEMEEPTTYKAYVEKSMKEDDEEAVVTKTIYTYSSMEAFDSAIETVVDSVESRLIESNFFAGTSFALFGLVGGELEFYKDGKDAFGVNASVSTTSIDDRTVVRQTTDFEIKYEKDLPACVNMTGEYSEKNSNLHPDYQPDMGDMETENTGSITITYSCGTIAVPTGFEEATTSYSAPSISVKSISVSSVL